MARRTNRVSVLMLSAALGRGCGSETAPAKGTGGSTAVSSVTTTGGAPGSTFTTAGTGGFTGATSGTQGLGGSTGSTFTTAGTGGSTGSTAGAGGSTSSSSATSAGTGGVAFTGTLSNTVGTGGSPSTTTLATAGAGGSPVTTTSSAFTTSTPSTSSSTSITSTSTPSTSSSTSTTSTSSTSSTSSTTSTTSVAAPAFDKGGPLACASGCASGSCCIDAAPAGWTGPFQLYSGSPAQAPACPQGAPAQSLLARRDPRQDPALCSTCTVGQPYGLWCFGVLAASSDGACTANDGGSLYLASDFCSRARGDSASAFAIQPPQATYVCDASTQSPTLPPIAWDTLGLGCAAAAAPACGAGKVCLPAPDAPFLPRLCVSKTGDASCPAGAFTDRAVYYTSAIDQRSCTPCGYTPAPITCTGTALLYDDASCTSELATVTDFSGACLALPDKFGSAGLVDPVFTGTPSCAPSGGVPVGAINPTGAVTVCCTP